MHLFILSVIKNDELSCLNYTLLYHTHTHKPTEIWRSIPFLQIKENMNFHADLLEKM